MKIGFPSIKVGLPSIEIELPDVDAIVRDAVKGDGDVEITTSKETTADGLRTTVKTTVVRRVVHTTTHKKGTP